MKRAKRRLKKLGKKEEQFLLNRLRREWQDAERAEKRHKVVQAAKVGGVMLAKSILAFAVLAGVVVIAAAAPNVFAAYGSLTKNSSRRFYKTNSLKNELEQLRRQGFVRARKTLKGYEVESTRKGEMKVFREATVELAIQKQVPWDGTWWLALFDIPRTHNAARDALRARLKQIGMEPLQASVFASKYPCADEVWFTARLFDAESYVTIAHVDSLEGYGERLAAITDVHRV